MLPCLTKILYEFIFILAKDGDLCDLISTDLRLLLLFFIQSMLSVHK